MWWTWVFSACSCTVVFFLGGGRGPTGVASDCWESLMTLCTGWYLL